MLLKLSFLHYNKATITMFCLNLGIHILMFEKIFKSFWKNILLMSFLVVAFSIVFYIELYTPDPIFVQ